MTHSTDNRGRKAINLESLGGKPNRQRIWEALRRSRDGFTISAISKSAQVHYETTATYIRSLEKGGYVELINMIDQQVRVYRVVQDNGIEAPRINREGQESQQGMGTEIMWRTLRMLREVDAQMLSDHAAAAGISIAVGTAKGYIKALKNAGYLRVTQPAKAGQRLERVALVATKNTGPRPPMIQRTKQVYDPNINQVVWSQAPEELL